MKIEPISLAAANMFVSHCRRGYSRVITYTLTTETGASLRAAGFTPTATRTRWERPLTQGDDPR